MQTRLLGEKNESLVSHSSWVTVSVLISVCQSWKSSSLTKERNMDTLFVQLVSYYTVINKQKSCKYELSNGIKQQAVSFNLLHFSSLCVKLGSISEHNVDSS